MEEGHITDKKGRKLKTFSWKPDGDVKGLVFLSHGSVFDVLLIFFTSNYLITPSAMQSTWCLTTLSWQRPGEAVTSWCLASIMLVTARVRGSE